MGDDLLADMAALARGDSRHRALEWLTRPLAHITAEWRGPIARIHSTHPRHGQLLRGSIRSVGIEPSGHQPSVRWRIVDYDGRDLGVHAGDFVDVQQLLLDATIELDETGDRS